MPLEKYLLVYKNNSSNTVQAKIKGIVMDEEEEERE